MILLRFAMRAAAAQALILAAVILTGAFTSGWADADLETASSEQQAIQGLLDEKKWAEADAAAQALLARLEAEGLWASLEAARALDAIVQAGLADRQLRRPELVRLAERAVHIKESLSPEDHDGLGRSSFQLANAVRVLVDRRQAILIYEKAIVHQELALGPEDPALARSIANLATLHSILGDYALADPLFERAARILEARLGPEHSDVGVVIAMWGNLKRNLGDYEGAKPLLEREIRIRGAAEGPRGMGVAVARMHLANLLAQMGDFRGAMAEYRRSLKLFKKSLEPGDPGFRLIYLDLGGTSLEMGDTRDASVFADRALASQPDGDKSRDTYWGDSLVLKADVLRRTRRPEQALPFYIQGLEVLEASYGPDHPRLVAALEGLSRARWLVGEADAAIETALSAEQIARDHFRRTAGALSEREALRFEKARRSALDSALSLLVSAGERPPSAAVARVWDAVIRSSTMVLDETAVRQRWLVQGADPNHRKVWDELVAARNELSRLVIKGPPEKDSKAYLSLVREAERRKEQAEKEAALASPWYERQVEIDTMDMEAIRSSLPVGAALVRYVPYTQYCPDSGETEIPSYLAFLSRPGLEEPILIPLGPAKPIEKALRDWRVQVTAVRPGRSRPGGFRDRRVERIGARLREHIWDPVAARLGDAREAFVVMSGALNLVSLAALPASAGGFLVEHEPAIHYLTTERDLVAASRPPERGHGLLIIGGPDYDATPEGAGSIASQGAPAVTRRKSGSAHGECTPLADRSFAALPGARKEAEEIAALWRSLRGEGMLSLTAAEALEAEVKRLAPGREIIHMATHGFFAEGRCDAAGRPVAPGRKRRGAGPLAASRSSFERPLLRTGLALAGANRRGEGETEDGILAAEEVAGLDLSGSDWIVLSACDTGIGTLSEAEGVLGLRRAVRIAGARTIIMSLWPVDDRATIEWMRGLYEARLAGQSTVESVRRASLGMLADLRRQGRSRHPASWGAFVAVGDWR